MKVQPHFFLFVCSFSISRPLSKMADIETKDQGEEEILVDYDDEDAVLDAGADKKAAAKDKKWVQRRPAERRPAHRTNTRTIPTFQHICLNGPPPHHQGSSAALFFVRGELPCWTLFLCPHPIIISRCTFLVCVALMAPFLNSFWFLLFFSRLPFFSCRGSYVGIHASAFRDFLLKSELLLAIQDCGFENPSQGSSNHNSCDSHGQANQLCFSQLVELVEDVDSITCCSWAELLSCGGERRRNWPADGWG